MKHSISHKTGDLLQNILSAAKVLEYQITHNEQPDTFMLAEIKQSVADLVKIIADHESGEESINTGHE